MFPGMQASLQAAHRRTSPLLLHPRLRDACDSAAHGQSICCGIAQLLPASRSALIKGKKKKSLVHAMKCMGQWAARSQGQTQPSPLQPCTRLWNNVPSFFFFSCLKSVLVILYKLQQFLCERPEAQPKVERELQLL